MKWQFSSHAIRKCDCPAVSACPLDDDGGAMKVLVATDAWRPQVNGVVRTLGSLARAAQKLGVEIEFLSPDGFWTFPVPTYPGLRLALPGRKRIAGRIEAAKPDAIHLATEGPIGHAVRDPIAEQQPPVHHQLYDALSRIYRGALADPGTMDLRALRRFHAARR
jgi:hypothetical protein